MLYIGQRQWQWIMMDVFSIIMRIFIHCVIRMLYSIATMCQKEVHQANNNNISTN